MQVNLIEALVCLMEATKGKRNKSSPLNSWEYPKKSSITIREVINRTAGDDYGFSYQVLIPAKFAGKRMRRQFKDKEVAFAWAKEQHEQLLQHGQHHYNLTGYQSKDAFNAFEILEGFDITLSQAAEFAKLHLNPPAGDISVLELTAILIEEKEKQNLRSRSINDIRSRLGIFSRSFGSRVVKEISQTEIEEWLNNFTTLSVRSIINYRLCLSTFFNYAVNKGFRVDNPVKKIPIPKIDWKPPVILKVTQAEDLVLHAAKTDEDMGLLPLVALGLFAGLRSTEIYRLDWSVIDLERQLLTVGPQIAKKRQLRVMDLMDNCVAWLQLCHNKKGKVAPAKSYINFAKLTNQAGFPHWGGNYSNAMRHSFGSYYYALTSDSSKTAAMLGHRSSDQMLFDHYRSLASRTEGGKYFSILPANAEQSVVAFNPLD